MTQAPASFPSPALRLALNNSARWDAEYGVRLASHLPMTLTALDRLQAGEVALGAFAQRYVKRLHAAPPLAPWPAGQPWQALLGQPRAWPMYRTLWRTWIEHEGAQAALEPSLPVLMQGVGAAAFHGLIRVSYALAANHAQALADALAYWSCRWFACGSAGEGLVGGGDGDATSTLGVSEVLAQLNFSADLGPNPDGLIADGMVSAALHARFAPAIARWSVNQHTCLPQLAWHAAKRYCTHPSFTTLHLITSAHAMHVVLPFMDEPDRPQALQHYAAAAAAAWATLPSVSPTRVPVVDVMPWPELIARAIESDDDHTIKLVDTCCQLEAAFGGSAWIQAASRRLAG
jgi:hypothetical protein